MQRVMAELANYFSAIPFLEIHLVLYGSKRKVFYKVNEQIYFHEPEIDLTDKSRLYFILFTLKFLRKTIRKINPDSILSFGEYWNNLVMLSLLGLKYPIYLSDRCQPSKTFGFLHGSLRKILYPRAKGIIAQTEIAKKLYANQFNHSNIKVIGNPIRRISDSYNQFKKENIILSVGRFIPTKHFDLLIDIFIKTNNIGWKLIIVGDDAPGYDVRESLQEKINIFNLAHQIILAGNISNVEEYYLKSKIFAFTSSSEGFPNVIGEAMSAGLPIIAFDCIAGPSDMVRDGKNGYLIPLFNIETFTLKLDGLMHDDELINQMAVSSKQLIADFSIEKIGQKFQDLLLHDREKF